MVGKQKAKTHAMRHQTTPPDSTTEQLHQIQLDQITIGEQMVRHDPGSDDIVELAADIARRGLRQPITVTPTDPGHFQLLTGSRRLAAHQRLGRPTILARIITEPAINVKGEALAENLLRKQMTLTEETNAVAHMHDIQKLSPAQIADLCGKERSWVLRRLAVRSLPPDVADALTQEAISLGAAEILSRLTDPSARGYILSQAIHCRLNIAQIRGMVETFEAAPSITEAIDQGLATTQPQPLTTTVLINCQTCGTPTPPPELAVLRTCHGCLTILNDPNILAALTGKDTETPNPPQTPTEQ